MVFEENDTPFFKKKKRANEVKLLLFFYSIQNLHVDMSMVLLHMNTKKFTWCYIYDKMTSGDLTGVGLQVKQHNIFRKSKWK